MSTHDEILVTWLEEQGDLDAVLFTHKLSPAQLRAFVADPLVIATMDAHESLIARRRRILASMHQQNAAEMLSKSMFEAGSLVECRRAATSLARLTRDMTRGTTPRTTTDADPSPKETTAPAVEAKPLSTAPPTQPRASHFTGSSQKTPPASADSRPTAPSEEPRPRPSTPSHPPPSPIADEPATPHDDSPKNARAPNRTPQSEASCEQ
jgi:hypothetical protein